MDYNQNSNSLLISSFALLKVDWDTFKMDNDPKLGANISHNAMSQ